MGGPRVRALARTFVAHVSNAVCLFSHGSSQSENGAYLSPFNPPPVPLIDQGLQHECYSETVRQLRALFPPTCALLEPEDVRVVGDTPIDAGGFADIWGGIIDGHSVLQKSYRCYEHCCDERIFRRYLEEVWVHTQLSHPNIVQFIGINPTPSHPFSLVLGAAGHLGLKEYLYKNPEANRMELVLGIARGLKHIHDQGIIHGHLTASILIGSDGTPRIADFGSSFVISRPDSWSGEDVVGFYRGSAPELLRPHKSGKPPAQITKASDMYAFGMLTWEIFSGKTPFYEDLDATVICRVLRGDRPSRPNHAELPDRMRKIVEACWDDTPSRRMAVGDVVTLMEAE